MTFFKPSVLVAMALLGATGALADGPVSAGPGATVAPLPAARPHHVYLVGTLRVSQPWVQTTGDTSAAYLLVENHSSSPERLIGAKVEGAQSVSLAPGGASGGDSEGGLMIPGNGQLALLPGGPHLVLNGMPAVAAKGPPIAGIVQFERSGDVHLDFLTDRDEAVGDDQTAPSTAKPPSPLQ